MDVERERGITVKSVCATTYHDFEGRTYQLNLIDTPGHIDFNWEVQRSLTACEVKFKICTFKTMYRFNLYRINNDESHIFKLDEGVILVVDATEGIQAQTMTNFFLAFELDLKIIPVLNKTDLEHANVPRCLTELETIFDIEPESVIQISAKTGKNVESVLDAIVERFGSIVHLNSDIYT